MSSAPALIPTSFPPSLFLVMPTFELPPSHEQATDGNFAITVTLATPLPKHPQGRHLPALWRGGVHFCTLGWKPRRRCFHGRP